MAVPLGGTGLSYSESAMISLFLEALFFGLFLFMFAISSFVLCRKRPQGQTSLANFNVPLLAVSTTMFILASVHLGIDMYRAMQGFVHFPGGAFAYLLATGTNTPAYVLKNVLYTTQTILGDGFIIYRLYQVWGHNRLVCAPFVLCFFGSIATGTGVLVSQTLRKPSQSIFSGALHDWPVAFYVMTFVVNVGCTTLIAYRIWDVNRQTKKLKTGTLVPVAVVIVESGLVYSIWVIILFALLLSNSGAYKIVQDTLMQLIGLVFCAIIASVGLGMSESRQGATGRPTKASALVFGSHSVELSNTATDHSRSFMHGIPHSTDQLDVEKGIHD